MFKRANYSIVSLFNLKICALNMQMTFKNKLICGSIGITASFLIADKAYYELSEYDKNFEKRMASQQKIVRQNDKNFKKRMASQQISVWQNDKNTYHNKIYHKKLLFASIISSSCFILSSLLAVHVYKRPLSQLCCSYIKRYMGLSFITMGVSSSLALSFLINYILYDKIKNGTFLKE